MIEIVTDRLVGFSDMIVDNGRLLPKTISNPIDIFSLEPCTGRESGFCFYDKKNQDVLICHVGITFQRNKFEVSYGTEEPFRNMGYMTESLMAVVEWLFLNTQENEVWGLPNGIVSESVLKKCGFFYDAICEEFPNMKWYKKARPQE